MGIEDRDYYREEQRKRRDAWYNPKDFRGQRGPRRQHGNMPRRIDWWRAIVFFLAVYGAVALFKDLSHRFSKPAHYVPPVFSQRK